MIDVVEVLEELAYINEETEAITGRTWYYACAVELMLETGAFT